MIFPMEAIDKERSVFKENRVTVEAVIVQPTRVVVYNNFGSWKKSLHKF